MPYNKPGLQDRKPLAEQFSCLLGELDRVLEKQDQAREEFREVLLKLHTLQEEWQVLAEDQKAFFHHDFRAPITTLAGLMNLVIIDNQDNIQLLQYMELMDKQLVNLMVRSKILVRSL